ncbi:MAG: WhiB family transcriptional regulator [Actinomycetota bacterium]|nr:WhiB family transcriptional regulator [Actinomycetota bacterium]
MAIDTQARIENSQKADDRPIALLSALTLANRERGAWLADAACATIEDPSIFYSSNQRELAQAVSICGNCHCAQVCLYEGMAHSWGTVDFYGVRAGMSAKAQKELSRTLTAEEVGSRLETALWRGGYVELAEVLG